MSGVRPSGPAPFSRCHRSPTASVATRSQNGCASAFSSWKLMPQTPGDEPQELPRGLQAHPMATQTAHDEGGVHRRSSRFHRPGQREAGESEAVSNQPRLPAGFGSEQVAPVKGIGAVGTWDVAAELERSGRSSCASRSTTGHSLCGGRADSDARRGHVNSLITCQAG